MVVLVFFFFFFFKQKTAYEMRISDWSSDVCSSDLSCIWGAALCRWTMISAPPRFRPMLVAALLGFVAETLSLIRVAVPHTLVFDEVHYVPAARTMLALATPVNTEHPQIGRASGRERVCQYVVISVFAVKVKK